jgi:hypothetical protein
MIAQAGGGNECARRVQADFDLARRACVRLLILADRLTSLGSNRRRRLRDREAGLLVSALPLDSPPTREAAAPRSSEAALFSQVINVGVEIGQEAILIALMPLAYLLRRGRFHRLVVLKVGSGVILLVATVWLLERAF